MLKEKAVKNIIIKKNNNNNDNNDNDKDNLIDKL